MTDPNWFYSALAQSAAAIVGLIGAFVTSRVMMMASERSRIENRINEINAEIKGLEREKHTGTVHYSNNVIREEERMRELFSKNAILKELMNQLNQIVLPKDFKWLIISLIYFTTVGVILPLCLLPITPEQHLFWKLIVLIFFITGLLAVFIYIFIEIKQITNKKTIA
ncbi:MAG: hypothetical protein JW945_07050 [Methanomicrobia archaeon]|nr:hypothetical protein [Methanomicrobia archaeon]